MNGIELLGYKVKDKITKMEGTVDAVSYDVSGCVQASVRPKSKENKWPTAVWIDTKRLKILSKNPVIAPQHDFSNPPGATDLPSKD